MPWEQDKATPTRWWRRDREMLLEVRSILDGTFWLLAEGRPCST